MCASIPEDLLQTKSYVVCSRDGFASLFPIQITFLSFPCLVDLSSLPARVRYNGGSRHSFLAPAQRGSSLSPPSMAKLWISTAICTRVQKSSSVPGLVSVLTKKGGWILSLFPLSVLRWPWDVWVDLYSVDVTSYIIEFWILNHPYIHEINLTLS